MKQKFKGVIDRVGLPRVIITAFFILLCILAIILKLPISMLMSDMLVRFGMNGVSGFSYASRNIMWYRA